MTVLILVELGIAALAGMAFVALYISVPWHRTPAGRHMMFVAAAMSMEALTLLLLGVGVPIPMWVFAVGYAVLDAVVVQRLVLLWRIRHD